MSSVSPQAPTNDGLGYVGNDVGLDSHVSLLAKLGIAAVATDLYGIICYWNRPAAELYGRGRTRCSERARRRSLSLEDDVIAASIVRDLLEVGRRQGECEIHDAGGALLRLEVRATVVVDRGGQPVGFEAMSAGSGSSSSVVISQRRCLVDNAQTHRGGHCGGAI
jgi:PAS domain-containing protein